MNYNSSVLLFHKIAIVFIALSLWCNNVVISSVDYKTALTNSLLYFEAQRAGKLPANQRVQWRGDSALQDGQGVNIDLSGGYYDAGDNVKFGYPMAFAMTMLSWGAIEYRKELAAAGELDHALDAIKWGTDYMINAHPKPDVLYAQVGDGDSDHACWQRPEDMTTPRTTYKIDSEFPGTDLAAETSAALAAASIVFNQTDPAYSNTLLNHAKELFTYANSAKKKVYQDTIPSATNFYASTNYRDELVWAATWLFRASNDYNYFDYYSDKEGTGGLRPLFSWNDKYVGAQVLVAKNIFDKKIDDIEIWAEYKSNAEKFICSCIQKSDSNFKLSPGGLLWFQEWNNLQFTTSATFIISVYYHYLVGSNRTSIECSTGTVQASELIAFAKTQVDYILGYNPNEMSYMVGFGASYPGKVHHRGASIVSIKKDPTPVTCKGGFDAWYNRNETNPNVLVGAIVGGPDANDTYSDSRSNFKQAEAAIANSAPFVGVLARFAMVA